MLSSMPDKNSDAVEDDFFTGWDVLSYEPNKGRRSRGANLHMTPEEESLSVYRLAIGCALAGNDRDFARMQELVAHLTKRELVQVLQLVAAWAGLASSNGGRLAWVDRAVAAGDQEQALREKLIREGSAV